MEKKDTNENELKWRTLLSFIAFGIFGILWGIAYLDYNKWLGGAYISIGVLLLFLDLLVITVKLGWISMDRVVAWMENDENLKKTAIRVVIGLAICCFILSLALRFFGENSWSS